jgi:hypothetical protein
MRAITRFQLSPARLVVMRVSTAFFFQPGRNLMRGIARGAGSYSVSIVTCAAAGLL